MKVLEFNKWNFFSLLKEVAHNSNRSEEHTDTLYYYNENEGLTYKGKRIINNIIDGKHVFNIILNKTRVRIAAEFKDDTLISLRVKDRDSGKRIDAIKKDDGFIFNKHLF